MDVSFCDQARCVYDVCVCVGDGIGDGQVRGRRDWPCGEAEGKWDACVGSEGRSVLTERCEMRRWPVWGSEVTVAGDGGRGTGGRGGVV